jgi:hypothetical protein
MAALHMMVLLALHTLHDMVYNMKEHVPMDHSTPMTNRDENYCDMEHRALVLAAEKEHMALLNIIPSFANPNF